MEAGDAGSKAAPPPAPSQMRAARIFDSSGSLVKNQTSMPGPAQATKSTAPSGDANAQVGSPGQKRRSRASREKWAEIKVQQNSTQCLARPRKLSELRGISEAAIVQPEGGFSTLGGFQLAIKEHCAKVGKKVSSSNSRTTAAGAARIALGKPVGISDRNRVRFVCSSDPSGHQ